VTTLAARPDDLVGHFAVFRQIDEAGDATGELGGTCPASTAPFDATRSAPRRWEPDSHRGEILRWTAKLLQRARLSVSTLLESVSPRRESVKNALLDAAIPLRD
jgi:hypothetical protein